MTEEEILTMKAGRALDIKVVENVMKGNFMVDEIFGDTEACNMFEKGELMASCLEAPFYAPLRRYSEDISETQRVVDKLKKNYDIKVEFDHNAEKWEAEFRKRKGDIGYPVAAAATIPEAICKAALLTVLEAKK
ncbi:hypothetical protein ACFLT4_03710 [Chloroflexota bacterium]